MIKKCNKIKNIKLNKKSSSHIIKSANLIMLGTIWYGNTKDSNDELLRSKNTLLNRTSIQ